jgi:hypothetical protein
MKPGGQIGCSSLSECGDLAAKISCFSWSTDIDSAVALFVLFVRMGSFCGLVGFFNLNDFTLGLLFSAAALSSNMTFLFSFLRFCS